MNRWINFAMFYVGWFACVVGAGRGQYWWGPTVAVVVVLAHLAATAERRQEARLIAAVSLFGFLVDTSLASAGMYSFTRSSIFPWLCPLWMVALWAMFATTLDGSIGWLRGRYLMAALFGAVGGPISYVAGARLGAIDLAPNAIASVGGIALVWAVAMPLLLLVRARWGTHPAERLQLLDIGRRGWR